MEDLRRKRVSSKGRVEAICTLCEVEARPNVLAAYEYLVVSTQTGDDALISVCSAHADQLDKGTLSYKVLRWRTGVDWAHPL
jgi:hypothetical protein